MQTMPKRFAAGIAAVTLVLSAAACSSGGSDSGSSTGAGGTGAAQSAGDSGGSSAVTAAKAAVAKYSKQQTALVVPALGKAVPANKTIAVLTCPLPVCQQASDATVRAAKAIGWSTKVFTNPLTPEGYVSAWKSMLQASPDGIVYIGVFPDTLISAQLAEVQQKKIPVVALGAYAGGKASSSGPVYASLAALPQFGLTGKLMADIIIADSGSTKPNAALLVDPNLDGTLSSISKNFSSEIKGAGGTADTIKVASADVGKAIPTQVVSYLQSHPNVKYLVGSRNDFLLGVPTALQSAGLADKVKLVGGAPQPSDIANIKSGKQLAAVSEEIAAVGYRAIDVILRVLVGATVFEPTATGWHQIVDKSNVSSLPVDASGSPATPGVPSAFLKAWGV